MKMSISGRKAIHPGPPPRPLALRRPPRAAAHPRSGWGSTRLSHNRRIPRARLSIRHPSRTSQVNNRVPPKGHRPIPTSNGLGPTARRLPSPTPRISACLRTQRSSRAARQRHRPVARRRARPRLPRLRSGLVRRRIKRAIRLSASGQQRLSRLLSAMALLRRRIRARVHRRTSDRPLPPRTLRAAQRTPIWAAWHGGAIVACGARTRLGFRHRSGVSSMMKHLPRGMGGSFCIPGVVGLIWLFWCVLLDNRRLEHVLQV